MAWLKGWSYRKSHEIVGSTAGAVTDYQVRVKVYYKPPELYKLLDGGHIGVTAATKPIALYEGTSIILPYQASDGNIHVKVLDASTLTETADYTVGADPIAGDLHGTPAIIKWGNYYVLIYGQHSGAGSLKVAYSTDLSTWTIYDFPLTGTFTYPQPFIWTDGNLYLFIRHSVSSTQTVWRLYKCTDITNPSSWSFVSTIINEGDGYGPYAKIRVENGRLIVCWGRLVYATSANDTKQMCAYTDDLTTWYNTDGTQVTLPLSSANCLLCTLPFPVKGGMSRAVGNTIYIIPGGGSLILIEKVIGGTLNTYSLPVDYGGPRGMFYHTEGFIRFYITSGTKLYRCKFDLTTKTTSIEKEYPPAVYAAGEGEEVHGTDDMVIVIYYRTSDYNAYAHDYLIVAGTTPRQLENYEVTLDGKCRTDFGDIRFTDLDGVTKLPYWIEEKVDGDYAIIWVKVPSIPANGTTTIYMYYGNSEAVSESDGEAVFEFFDDFNTDTIASGRWTVVAGTWQVDTANSLVWNDDSAKARIKADFNDNGNHIYEVRLRHDEVGEYSWAGLEIKSSLDDEGDYDNGYMILHYGDTGNGTIFKATSGSLTELASGSISIPAGQFFVMKVIYDSGDIKLYINEQLIASATDTTYTSGEVIRLFNNATNNKSSFDWIRVRKYIDPEPTHGVWGSEETAIKVWDGSQWKNIKAIYYWDGSSWVEVKGVYYWDGSQWKQVF